MKKGTDWETKIEEGLKEMDLMSPHTISKTEPPVRVIRYQSGGTFLACFTAAGQCDFEGGWKGRIVCLEAKEISNHRFPITLAKHNKIKEHQVRRLDRTLEMGGISGLLIRFRPKDRSPVAFAVPWALRQATLDTGAKSFAMETLARQGAVPLSSPVRVTGEELDQFFELCLALHAINDEH